MMMNTTHMLRHHDGDGDGEEHGEDDHGDEQRGMTVWEDNNIETNSHHQHVHHHDAVLTV